MLDYKLKLIASLKSESSERPDDPNRALSDVAHPYSCLRALMAHGLWQGQLRALMTFLAIIYNYPAFIKLDSKL